MIHVKNTVRIEAPIEYVWRWLSDLETLVTANMFHHKAHFQSQQRSGVGTRMVVYHRLFGSPPWARFIRITHWEEEVRLGWVETDSISIRYAFPHSQQWQLRSIESGATLLTDELRGSLNFPLIGNPADALAQKLLVTRALRRESLHIKREIEEAFARKTAAA